MIRQPQSRTNGGVGDGPAVVLSVFQQVIFAFKDDGQTRLGKVSKKKESQYSVVKERGGSETACVPASGFYNSQRVIEIQNSVQAAPQNVVLM